MLNHLSILLTGFSIFSLVVLLIAYLFFLPDMRKSISGKIAATALLFSLIILQSAHYLFFSNQTELLEYRGYVILLVLIPTSFFFFSRVVLFPDVEHKKTDALHFIPGLLGLFLPVNFLALLGFLLGSCYTSWFARLILKLRPQGARFKFELFFFGLFAVIALAIFALCLSLPYINTQVFYFTYANAISICLLLIICALLFYPKLLSDILLITELTYTKSKLTGINTEEKLAQLESIMSKDKLYQNEELSLSLLADQLDLSTHQLSELINTQFDVNFPRYIREQRIIEAKRLLIEEPTTSILSISMETGFKSQSNFYTAFKEITGISPGQYRKKKS